MDQALRTAERTGDRLQLIHELLRSGRLPLKRLTMAARLGDPDALAVMPVVAQRRLYSVWQAWPNGVPGFFGPDQRKAVMGDLVRLIGMSEVECRYRQAEVSAQSLLDDVDPHEWRRKRDWLGAACIVYRLGASEWSAYYFGEIARHITDPEGSATPDFQTEKHPNLLLLLAKRLIA